jgi:PhnB protein
MAKVSAVPQGMHTVIPVLNLKGGAEAIEFFKKAFGAEEMSRALDPSGKFIWHAALRIGDSTIFISDEMPEMGVPARPTRLWLYLDGVDAAFKRATSAGCKVLMPLADMFWGDRMGKLEDKWGNEWSLAQRIKDLTPQEMKAAQAAFIEQMSKKK